MSATKKTDAPLLSGRRFREFAIRNRYIWISFLVPFVLMVTAFGLMSVSPTCGTSIFPSSRISRTSSKTASRCSGHGRWEAA